MREGVAEAAVYWSENRREGKKMSTRFRLGRSVLKVCDKVALVTKLPRKALKNRQLSVVLRGEMTDHGFSVPLGRRRAGREAEGGEQGT